MQNYLDDKENREALIRFPSGWFLTVMEITGNYNFVGGAARRKNIAYTVMGMHALEWLLKRTNIGLTPNSMLCKVLIVLRGSLAEFLLIDAIHPKKKGSFGERAEHLKEMGVINQGLKDELVWLWDIRCNIHLDKLFSAEHLTYERKDVERARMTVRKLRFALTAATRGQPSRIFGQPLVRHKVP
jgi:hypothetical protein